MARVGNVNLLTHSYCSGADFKGKRKHSTPTKLVVTVHVCEIGNNIITSVRVNGLSCLIYMYGLFVDDTIPGD